MRVNVIQAEDGNILIEEDQIAERWKEYMEKLYGEGKNNTEEMKDEQIEEDNLGPSIMVEEFEKAQRA